MEIKVSKTVDKAPKQDAASVVAAPAGDEIEDVEFDEGVPEDAKPMEHEPISTVPEKPVAEPSTAAVPIPTVTRMDEDADSQCGKSVGEGDDAAAEFACAEGELKENTDSTAERAKEMDEEVDAEEVAAMAAAKAEREKQEEEEASRPEEVLTFETYFDAKKTREDKKCRSFVTFSLSEERSPTERGAVDRALLQAVLGVNCASDFHMWAEKTRITTGLMRIPAVCYAEGTAADAQKLLHVVVIEPQKGGCFIFASDHKLHLDNPISTLAPAGSPLPPPAPWLSQLASYLMRPSAAASSKSSGPSFYAVFGSDRTPLMHVCQWLCSRAPEKEYKVQKLQRPYKQKPGDAPHQSHDAIKWAVDINPAHPIPAFISPPKRDPALPATAPINPSYVYTVNGMPQKCMGLTINSVGELCVVTFDLAKTA